MNKIPVARTIAFGYAYLFHQIGAIVSVTWLPALIFAGADAAMRLFPNDANTGVDPVAELIGDVPTMIAVTAIVAAQAMAATGITRQVLSRPASGVAAVAAFDRTGLRMMAANMRFYLGVGVLAMLAAIVSLTAFWLAGVRVDTPETAQATTASLIAAVLSLSLFAYVVVTAIRMGFFLPGAVAMEEKSGLKRSHDLAMGNFWRILAVLLALMLPPGLLRLAGQFAVFGSDLFSQDDPAAFLQATEAAIRAQILPWEIFNAVLFVLGSGLLYAGLAYAYRAAVPETGARAFAPNAD